jgi:hypothetical protein
MKKILLIIAVVLIYSQCFAGILTRHDYVLKKVFGDHILYILPNGMMYKHVDAANGGLVINEIYLNSFVTEAFTFKSNKSLKKFIKKFGDIKCTAIKGVGKCPDPKETEE